MDDGDDHEEDVEEEDDGHVDQGLGQPVLPVAQQLLLVPLVEQRGWRSTQSQHLDLDTWTLHSPSSWENSTAAETLSLLIAPQYFM